MSAKIVNLAEFLNGLKGDVREVEETTSRIVRRFALGALRRLVLASPVDTGRFRGNWQITVGPEEAAGETGRTDRSGAATIAAGMQAISAQRGFDRVVIVNNVEYGPDLNNGSSKQAPAGFVEAAIDAEMNLTAST